MVKRVNILITGLVAIGLLCSGTQRTGKSVSPYRVVGYIGGWDELRLGNMDAFSMTHINYAFANLIDERLVFEDVQRDGSNLEKLKILRETNEELKLLVSVGGWGWSGGFSDAALSETSRVKMAESVVHFIRTYELDGIDLDWEYPGLPGAGNVYRQEDKQNFTLMLAEIRRQFEAETKKTGKHYLLTIATGGMDEYIDHTELGKAQEYLDFINIMSYDLYNGGDSVTGHHSNLYFSKYQTGKKLSTDWAVELHHKQGIPLNKLVVGVPFYGRKWDGVKAGKNHGLSQKATSGGVGVNYNVINEEMVNKAGYKRYWDTVAQVPYLWNESKKEFISYEDETSLKNKCNYVKQKGLGGIMFWEYSADDHDHTLLNIINKAFSK